MNPADLIVQFPYFFEDNPDPDKEKAYLLNYDLKWNEGVEVSFNYHCPATPEDFKALLISGNIPFQIGIRFSSPHVFPSVLMRTLSFLLKSDNCPKKFELRLSKSQNLLKSDQLEWINWCAALIRSGQYPEGFLLTLWYSDIISDGNARVLFSALGSSCIKKSLRLNLTHTRIDDKDFDWLFKSCKTGTLPEGFELILSDNERDSKRKIFEGLAEKHLAQHSIETRLKALVGVGDETAQQLAVMISSGYFAKNSKVSLSHNKITDTGAKALLTVITTKNCPEDFQLDLRGNYIQRKGLETFIDTLNSGARTNSLKISFIITVEDVDLVAAILTSRHSPASVEQIVGYHIGGSYRHLQSNYQQLADRDNLLPSYCFNDLTVYLEHNVIKIFLRIKENDHELLLALFSILRKHYCRDLATMSLEPNKNNDPKPLKIQLTLSEDDEYNRNTLEAASSIAANHKHYHLTAFVPDLRHLDGQAIESAIEFLASKSCPNNFTLNLSKFTMVWHPEDTKKLFERLKSGVRVKHLKLDLSDNYLSDDWAMKLAEILSSGVLPEHFSLLLYNSRFSHRGIASIDLAIRSGKVAFGTRIYVDIQELEKTCVQNDARITKTAFFKIILLQIHAIKYNHSCALLRKILPSEIIKYIASFIAVSNANVNTDMTEKDNSSAKLENNDNLKSPPHNKEPKQSKPPLSTSSSAFFKLPFKLIVHIGEFLPIKITLDEVVNRLYGGTLWYRHGILAGMCLYSYVVNIDLTEKDNSSEHVAVSDANAESSEESNADVESGEESNTEADAESSEESVAESVEANANTDVQNQNPMPQATGCRCNLF